MKQKADANGLMAMVGTMVVGTSVLLAFNGLGAPVVAFMFVAGATLTVWGIASLKRS